MGGPEKTLKILYNEDKKKQVQILVWFSYFKSVNIINHKERQN